MQWTMQRTSRRRSGLLVLLALASGPGWLAAVALQDQLPPVESIAVLKADQDGDGIPDLIDDEVTVLGVLTVGFARGAAGFNSQIQDESGGIAIALRDFDAHRAREEGLPWLDPEGLRAGDLLRVRGSLTEVGQLVMLVATQVEHVARVPPPAIPELTIRDILEGDRSGDRVRVTANVEATPGLPETARLTDTTGSIPLWVGQDLLANADFVRELGRGGTVTVAGVVQGLKDDAGGVRYRIAIDGRTPMTFHPAPPWSRIVLVGVVLSLLVALLYVGTRRAVAERRSREMEVMVKGLAAAKETLRVSREALRASEAQYRSLIEHAPFGVFRATTQGALLLVNRALVDMLGHDSGADVLRLDLANEVFQDRTVWDALCDELRANGRSPILTVPWRARNGATLNVRVGLRLISMDRGSVEAVEGFAEDVTERLRLEDELRQSQKMEGIGQLAGGVAHDFNNLLTVILGSCEFLLAGNLDGEIEQEVDQIRTASLRAASLTQQLLAFSKRQPLAPQLIDVNESVCHALKLLRRVVGEPIEFIELLSPDLDLVEVDPGQFQQVIMNLVINAKDAMPAGGKVWIRTAQVDTEADEDGVLRDLPPGRYAVLSVVDSGAGIPPELLDRIFEPFFTTKEVGKGTGLGLSTVYGIVSQSGGHVRAESPPGCGAAFHIYLPSVSGAGQRDDAADDDAADDDAADAHAADDEAELARVVLNGPVGTGAAVTDAAVTDDVAFAQVTIR